MKMKDNVRFRREDCNEGKKKEKKREKSSSFINSPETFSKIEKKELLKINNEKNGNLRKNKRGEEKGKTRL